MFRLFSILALVLGIAGCVAAQPPGYGSGDEPAYYAPRTGLGIGIGGGSFGGGGVSGGGGVGVGVGF
jgi:hypothetical protein